MGLLWLFVTLFIVASLYFFNTKVPTLTTSVTGDLKNLAKKKKKKGKGKKGEVKTGLEEVEKENEPKLPSFPEVTNQKVPKKGKKGKTSIEVGKSKVVPLVENSQEPTQSTEPKKKKKGSLAQTNLQVKKEKTKVVKPEKGLNLSSLQKGKKSLKLEKKSVESVKETTSSTTLNVVDGQKEDAWYKEEVEKPPARVIKIKGPEPESGSEEEPAEEGWVKIKRTVHSPKMSTKTPTNIELLNETTVIGQPILTKTQRKNARRALKRKEEREIFQQQQELRLRQHRRELMDARINSKEYAPKPEASRWNIPRATEEDEASQGSSENTGLIWDV